MVYLREMAIDIVVTDMLMPGISGLELLDYVHKQPRKVPVIVISGQQDAMTAVEALRKGAASFVPKAELASRLNSTIKQVFAAYKSEKSYSELIESVDDVSFHLRLQNDPLMIPALVSVLQQLAVGMKLCGDEGRTRLGIAIDEAVMNAMYHGNLQLPVSDLVETRSRVRDGETAETIESRRKDKSYADRLVHVHVVLNRESIEITVRDEGEGFSPDEIEQDGDVHRGLTLIRNLVDEVTFNEVGNEIKLLKRREIMPGEPTIPLE
jgi:CheY-like chemotaxis protein